MKIYEKPMAIIEAIEVEDVITASTSKAVSEAEVDALYNRLSNCPVPSVPVYGRQPIFTCNNGCGCGNNGLYGTSF